MTRLLIPCLPTPTGPLRICLYLEEVQLSDGHAWKRLRVMGNGFPIQPDKVSAMLNLGHQDRKVEVMPSRRAVGPDAGPSGPWAAHVPSSGPSMAGGGAAGEAAREGPEAGASSSAVAKVEAGENEGQLAPAQPQLPGRQNHAASPVYGMFGHGTFISVCALAHHALWLGW